MRVAWVGLLFVAVAVSGCLGDSDEDALPGVALTGSDLAALSGQTLPCLEQCVLDDLVLADDDANAAYRLGIWIAWDETRRVGPNATVTAPDGSECMPRVGYREAVCHFIAPQAGTYVVDGAWDDAFEVGFTVEWDPVAASEPIDLLPNLVNLIPSDLSRRTPVFEGPELWLPTGNGCGVSEIARHRAMECLRLSNAIGNTGQGYLELRTPMMDAMTGFPEDVRFTQMIERSDGTVRAEAVGLADFHEVHGHWHYGGFQHFQLYSFDMEAGVRGETASQGAKPGFCAEDREKIADYEGPSGERTYSAGTCMMSWEGPTATPEVMLGLSAGWYDLYWSELSDQYVEISGVPDGVYELVATTQSYGILESVPWDNSASVVLELIGGQPTVLERHGLYERPME